MLGNLAAKIQPRNSRKVMCTRIAVPAIEPIVSYQNMGGTLEAKAAPGGETGMAGAFQPD